MIFFLFILNFLFFLNFNKFAKKINLYDIPDYNRKIHFEKTASLGGIIFFINISLIFLTEFFNLFKIFNNLFNKSELIQLYAYYFLFWLLGILDDKKNLKVFFKTLVSSILIFSYLYLNNNLLITELKSEILNKNIYLYNYSFIFTFFCIFIFQNAFNMFDGSDLQISNYIFVLLIFFALLSLSKFFIYLMVPLIFFYILNYKKKVFLGNNGSISLSFIFSIFFIKFYNNFSILFIEEIILIMLIPGLDLIRLFITRILLFKNPLSPDNRHIHHLLLKKFKNIICQLIIFILVVLPIFFYFIIQNYLIAVILGVIFYFLFILYSKY